MLKPTIFLKLSVILFSLIFAETIFGQSSITVEASQVYSKFRFISSNGEKDISYSYKPSSAYHFGYMHSLESGVFFQGNIGTRKGGATYVLNEANYQWDLNYFDFRLGVGYAYSFGNIDAYLGISPYFSHLLTANQILDNESFDIIKDGSLKRSDIGMYISPGAQYKVTNSMSIYGQFDTMIGLSNLENSDSEQITNNRAIAFAFGLSFSLQSITNPSF